MITIDPMLDVDLLVRQVTPELGRLFSEMHKAGATFDLTGSRRGGVHHADSDWDFFVEDNGWVRSELIQLGFATMVPEEVQQEYRQNPDDPELNYTVDTYQHTELPVQVQLVKSLEWAQRTRDLIYKTPALWRLDYSLCRRKATDPEAKSIRATLWTSTMMITKLQLDEEKVMRRLAAPAPLVALPRRL